MENGHMEKAPMRLKLRLKPTGSGYAVASLGSSSRDAGDDRRTRPVADTARHPAGERATTPDRFHDAVSRQAGVMDDSVARQGERQIHATSRQPGDASKRAFPDGSFHREGATVADIGRSAAAVDGAAAPGGSGLGSSFPAAPSVTLQDDMLASVSGMYKGHGAESAYASSRRKRLPDPLPIPAGSKKQRSVRRLGEIGASGEEGGRAAKAPRVRQSIHGGPSLVEFVPGELVWGKVDGHPWWPGEIVAQAAVPKEVGMKKRKGCACVMFYGPPQAGGGRQYAWLRPEHLAKYQLHVDEFSNQIIPKQSQVSNFQVALEEIASTAAGLPTAQEQATHAERRDAEAEASERSHRSNARGKPVIDWANHDDASQGEDEEHSQEGGAGRASTKRTQIVHGADVEDATASSSRDGVGKRRHLRLERRGSIVSSKGELGLLQHGEAVGHKVEPGSEDGIAAQEGSNGGLLGWEEITERQRRKKEMRQRLLKKRKEEEEEEDEEMEEMERQKLSLKSSQSAGNQQVEGVGVEEGVGLEVLYSWHHGHVLFAEVTASYSAAKAVRDYFIFSALTHLWRACQKERGFAHFVDMILGCRVRQEPGDKATPASPSSCEPAAIGVAERSTITTTEAPNDGDGGLVAGASADLGGHTEQEKGRPPEADISSQKEAKSGLQDGVADQDAAAVDLGENFHQRKAAVEGPRNMDVAEVPLQQPGTAAPQVADAPEMPRASQAAAVSGVPALEYLVKWQGRSHIHNEWVGEERLRALSRQKLDNFRLKYREAFWQPKPSFDLMDDKLWAVPQKVVARRAGQNGRKEVLVKWCQLTYDKCTWEWENHPILVQHEGLVNTFDRVEEETLALEGMIEKGKRELDERQKSKGFGPILSRKDGSKVRRMAMGDALPAHVPWLETQPASLKGCDLFPHQLEALNWLLKKWHTRTNVILADEMGLGKTISATSFVQYVKGEVKAWAPCLILVPLSTMPNWQAELKRWAPDLNVVEYYGPAQARSIIRQYEFHSLSPKVGKRPKAYKFDIMLTTYEMILHDTGVLRPIPWEILIVDEGHRLKNAESKLFTNLNTFSFAHRVLLTGTPLQNNVGELHNLLNFLQPDKFSSLASFMDKIRAAPPSDRVVSYHDQADELGQDKQTERTEEEMQVDALKALVKPHMLRRTKKDVMQDIPPREERLVEVELTELQAQYYRALLTRNYELLRQSAAKSGQYQSLMNIMMQLRKVCNHPYLIKGTEPLTGEAQALHDMRVQASGKLVLLDAMLGKLQAHGHKVLIFSQMTALLDILQDYLNMRYGTAVYGRLDGNVDVERRQRAINRFNQDKDCFVFLLSTRAGGVGINLASADTVIIYDSDFNPQQDLQAISRAHRYGQLNKLIVYRLMVKASVEERILKLANEKLKLTRLFTQKTGSARDVEDILLWGTKKLFDNEQAMQIDEEVRGGEDRSKGDGGSGGAEEEDYHTSKRSAKVWDDAKVDELLDRSTIGTEIEHAAEEEGDILGSVKALDVKREVEAAPEEDEATVKEGEGHEDINDDAAEGAGAGPDGQAAGQPDENVWDALLRTRWEQAQAEAQVALGRGKRQRKAVSYMENDSTRNKPLVEAPEQSDEDDDEVREYTAAGKAYKEKWARLRARQVERIANRGKEAERLEREAKERAEAFAVARARAEEERLAAKREADRVRRELQRMREAAAGAALSLAPSLLKQPQLAGSGNSAPTSSVPSVLPNLSPQFLASLQDAEGMFQRQIAPAPGPATYAGLQSAQSQADVPLPSSLGLLSTVDGSASTVTANVVTPQRVVTVTGIPVGPPGAGNVATTPSYLAAAGAFLKEVQARYAAKQAAGMDLLKSQQQLDELTARRLLQHQLVEPGTQARTRDRSGSTDQLHFVLALAAPPGSGLHYRQLPAAALKSSMLDASGEDNRSGADQLAMLAEASGHPRTPLQVAANAPASAAGLLHGHLARGPIEGLTGSVPNANLPGLLATLQARAGQAPVAMPDAQDGEGHGHGGSGSRVPVFHPAMLPVMTPPILGGNSAWGEEELDILWVAVRRHGKGNWSAMLRDASLPFAVGRKAEGLANRWKIEERKLFGESEAAREERRQKRRARLHGRRGSSAGSDQAGDECKQPAGPDGGSEAYGGGSERASDVEEERREDGEAGDDEEERVEETAEEEHEEDEREREGEEDGNVEEEEEVEEEADDVDDEEEDEEDEEEQEEEEEEAAGDEEDGGIEEGEEGQEEEGREKAALGRQRQAEGWSASTQEKDMRGDEEQQQVAVHEVDGAFLETDAADSGGAPQVLQGGFWGLPAGRCSKGVPGMLEDQDQDHKKEMEDFRALEEAAVPARESEPVFERKPFSANVSERNPSGGQPLWFFGRPPSSEIRPVQEEQAASALELPVHGGHLAQSQGLARGFLPPLSAERIGCAPAWQGDRPLAVPEVAAGSRQPPEQLSTAAQAVIQAASLLAGGRRPLLPPFSPPPPLAPWRPRELPTKRKRAERATELPRTSFSAAPLPVPSLPAGLPATSADGRSPIDWSALPRVPSRVGPPSLPASQAGFPPTFHRGLREDQQEGGSFHQA
eukprot:SM000056S17991  [mRNA]  locus=s56:546261:559125:- [translate_table: standard]